ncbi:unnamed protein product [Paramecium pentaurelia]|uniref:Protein kinase domain-containing protein n=1 Tax=Paramecium pentaurelia TaxID=43138 RepID=A0A8S1VK53_9CILI|nr:unnamed protein product [Paramecium pentaurelia]
MKVFKKNKQQCLHGQIIKLIDNLEWNANRVTLLEYCPKDLIQYQIENLYIDCKCINPELKIQILWIYISHIEIQLNDLNIYLINLLILIIPENQMIGNDNMIRIIDFRKSKISDMIIKFQLPKLNWMVLLNIWIPFQKCDLWFMGATLYYIFKNQILNINQQEINIQAKKNKHEAKLEMVQEMINQSLIQLPFAEQLKQLLDKLLKVDHKQIFGWNQLFKNGLIKQLFESILQEQIQHQGNRKKLIKLSFQMNKDFFSVGPILTETLYNIINKGKQSSSTVMEIFKCFIKMNSRMKIL